MATPLGHIEQQNIQHVYASAAISAGEAVAIDASAPLKTGIAPDTAVADHGAGGNDDQGTDPAGTAVAVQVAKFAAGDDSLIGVALEDIAADEIGRIVTRGPVRAVTGTDVAINEHVQADTADASFADFATGDKHGIALEAGSATALTWIWLFGTPTTAAGGAV